MFEQPVYHTCEAVVQPGDILLLYTDGVYEIFQGEKEFGLEGFMATVRQYSALPVPDLLDRTLDTARTFGSIQSFEDDVCLLAIETSFENPPTLKK